jgi:hypothetical protein
MAIKQHMRHIVQVFTDMTHLPSLL